MALRALRRRTHSLLAAALGYAGGAFDVGADTAAVRFDLDYAAPDVCPDARAFARQVLARTTRAELVRDGSAEQSLSIVITRSGAVHRGTLHSRSADRALSERTIEARDCEDVAAALALVAALALDPNARTEPLPAAELASPEVEEAPSEQGRPTPAPATPRLRSNAIARDAERRRGAALEWAWGTGISLELSRGVAPGWMVAPRVHAVFELWPSRWYSPALQLSAAAGTRSFEHTLTDVALSWRAVRFEGCPARLQISGELALRPCAFFEAGELEGEAAETESVSSRSTERPWYAAGAIGHLLFAPARPLSIQAHGGISLPLQRDTFALASAEDGPLIPVHEVPAAGVVLALGVALDFQ